MKVSTYLVRRLVMEGCCILVAAAIMGPGVMGNIMGMANDSILMDRSLRVDGTRILLKFNISNLLVRVLIIMIYINRKDYIRDHKHRVIYHNHLFHQV